MCHAIAGQRALIEPCIYTAHSGIWSTASHYTDTTIIPFLYRVTRRYCPCSGMHLLIDTAYTGKSDCKLSCYIRTHKIGVKMLLYTNAVVRSQFRAAVRVKNKFQKFDFSFKYRATKTVMNRDNCNMCYLLSYLRHKSTAKRGRGVYFCVKVASIIVVC